MLGWLGGLGGRGGHAAMIAFNSLADLVRSLTELVMVWM